METVFKYYGITKYHDIVIIIKLNYCIHFKSLLLLLYLSSAEIYLKILIWMVPISNAIANLNACLHYGFLATSL